MKRFLSMALALVLSVSAFAEGFGLVGGFTTSQLVVKDIDMKACTGFNAGVMYNIPLVSGLAIQPELLYNVKGASLDAIDLKSQLGYVELPVQLQWGLDLLLLRPYIFTEPFIGYAVNWSASESHTSIGSDLSLDKLNSRLEYGLGVGAGVDLFDRIQLSFRYYWNFEDCGVGNYFDLVKDHVTERESFNGLLLTIGVFF
mgnify:CR=1 FL=1